MVFLFFFFRLQNLSFDYLGQHSYGRLVVEVKAANLPEDFKASLYKKRVGITADSRPTTSER